MNWVGSPLRSLGNAMKKRLSVIAAASLVAITSGLGTGIAQNLASTPIVTSVPPIAADDASGCASDVQRLCSSGIASGSQQQCLQSQAVGTVSPACRAALAQNPPPGIAKNLGFDPAPQPGAQPVPVPPNLVNYNPPPAIYPSTVATNTPSPPVASPPVYVRSSPTTDPNAVTTVVGTSAPVTTTSSPAAAPAQ